MRIFLAFCFIILSISSNGQNKDILIMDGAKDSVLVFPGEGFLAKGNCLLIKYTGDPQKFFNELVSYHALDEKLIERTQTTLSIYETTKPYWVYGTYSVHAKLEKRGTFTLIEIYFRAYNNPDNYKMHGANSAYQEIVNSLLNK